MKDLVVAAIGYGIGATSVAYAIVWFSKRKQLPSPVKAAIPIVGFLVACLVTILMIIPFGEPKDQLSQAIFGIIIPLIISLLIFETIKSISIKNNLKFRVYLFLLISIMVFGVYSTVKSVSQSELDKFASSPSEHNEVLASLNKDLPKMADSETRLDKIEVLRKDFNYFYTLINYSKSQLDVNQIANQLSSQLQEITCKNEVILQGGTMNYFYYGKDSELIAKISFSKSICGLHP